MFLTTDVCVTRRWLLHARSSVTENSVINLIGFVAKIGSDPILHLLTGHPDRFKTNTHMRSLYRNSAHVFISRVLPTCVDEIRVIGELAVLPLECGRRPTKATRKIKNNYRR